MPKGKQMVCSCGHKEDATETTQNFTYTFTATDLTISFEGGDTNTVPYSVYGNELTITAPDGIWFYTKQ